MWNRFFSAAATKEPRVVGGMIGEAELHGATKDLQRSVRSLYREFLRASTNDPGLRENVREGFRKDMAATSVQRVDFLLRQGHKRLALVKSPGFKGVSSVTAKK